MNSYLEIKEYPLDGTDLKYYSISDLKISKFDGLETKNIYGNSYMIEITGHNHFHHFQDKVGQYEMLKALVPDLKLILVGDFKDHYPPNEITAGALVLEQSLSIYGIPGEDIIFLDKNNVWFEKTFYFIKIFNRFLDDSLPGNKLLGPGDGKDYYSYNIKTAEKVRELYLKSLGLKDNKIFITRIRMNNIVRKMAHLLEKSENGFATEQEENELLNTTRIFGTMEDAKRVIRERLISEEDEQTLENFFMSIGYSIIDPYDMTFFQQVKLFNRATHIASVRGSGLYNTIFCNESAKVFIIDLSNEYDFEYKSIVGVATKNIYEIPVKNNILRSTHQTFFKVENIINILKSHYADQL